jgi:predicted Rossmann fold nucleotide-binding protein DprA/Smf involved in DNA uptake
MRIIISGSREFNNYEIIENKILDIIGKLNSNNNVEIVSGGCRGVDKCAEMFAYRNGYEFTEFPADWSLGKRAGYLRNKQMAEYASESVNGTLISFWNMKSRGTKMMIDLARQHGLDVYIINLLDMKIYR